MPSSHHDLNLAASGPLAGLPSLVALEPWRLGLAAAGTALATALGLYPFFAVAEMATAIYAVPAKLERVQSLALLAAGALGLRYVLIAGTNVLAHIAAFRILHTLRVRLVRKLGAVPLAFFGHHGPGELKKTLMDDVNQIESFIAHHFPDGVAAALVPMSTGVVLLWVDWRMALAAIAAGPLAVAAMAVAMRGAGDAQQGWTAIQDRINESLIEYFRGIQVIKGFGLSASRFGHLARSIESGRTWMERFMRTNGRGYGAFGALIGSSLLVLMPTGGWLYSRGALSVEDLVLFLVLGPQLLGSLLRLMFAWGNVERIKIGNARIHALLSAPELDSAGAAGSAVEPLVPRRCDVAFRDVSFCYEQERAPVLQGVSFEARAGQVTALVGPSGAGKTTLVRLIPRLWEPSTGSVALGGRDIREYPIEQLLALVSVVFQEVFLFHGSVRDNLRLGRPDASDEMIEAACRAARAHEFIEALPEGYDTLLGERGARLSGGEKQRLSIARALLKDAPILLLDEATAFADPESEACIQDALSLLCEGRTVLVVAHRLTTIASADRIVVLDGGRVRAAGTHGELVDSCELYRELWNRHRGAADWTIAASRPAAPRAEEGDIT